MNAFAQMVRRLPVEDFDAAPPPPAAAPMSPFCPCPRCATAGRTGECPSQAYEEGLARGRSLRAVEDATAAETLTLEIADALARGAERAAADAERVAEALAGLVIAAAMSVLPASCARLGAQEARAIADAVLPALATEPAVTIDADADTHDAIATAITRLPRASQSRITLHRQGAEGDQLRITWSAGMVRRSPAEAVARVHDTLSRFGLAPPLTETAPQSYDLEPITHG